MMDINATFWHPAKVNFTVINSLVWWMTVPNMNKINPFFYEISQQIHKMYEKLARITQEITLIFLTLKGVQVLFREAKRSYVPPTFCAHPGLEPSFHKFEVPLQSWKLGKMPSCLKSKVSF